MFYVDKEIEVRYAETDQMGVVYHGNYLTWLEVGRTAFVKQLGYDPMDMEAQGVLTPVAHVDLTYRSPVMYGDKVFVRTQVKLVTAARTIYYAEVLKEDGTVCLQSECTITCVDKESFRVKSFKKLYPEWYKKYDELQKEFGIE